MQALKEKGIGTGIHFRAVHQHRWYREHPEFVRGPLVNTDWNSERLLSLPLFPGMELSDVERVVRASCEILA
jgi:UDP-4-amino-4-deoxy-L-arabinose-oxoglutarate aminotransferase